MRCLIRFTAIKGKTGGVLSDDPQMAKEKIYRQYLKKLIKKVFLTILRKMWILVRRVSKTEYSTEVFFWWIGQGFRYSLERFDSARTATSRWKCISASSGDLAMVDVNKMD